jgi:cytochrome subunit of sulfide dehydrogenase
MMAATSLSEVRMTLLRIAVGIATILAWTLLPAVAASLPPVGAASCSGCHSPRAGATSPVARLNGRDAGELLAALAAFRDGSRPATVMTRLAKGFSDDELRAIATWLAAQK